MQILKQRFAYHSSYSIINKANFEAKEVVVYNIIQMSSDFVLFYSILFLMGLEHFYFLV